MYPLRQLNYFSLTRNMSSVRENKMARLILKLSIFEVKMSKAVCKKCVEINPIQFQN